jgi:hypothetical protein
MKNRNSFKQNKNSAVNQSIIKKRKEIVFSKKYKKYSDEDYQKSLEVNEKSYESRKKRKAENPEVNQDIKKRKEIVFCKEYSDEDFQKQQLKVNQEWHKSIKRKAIERRAIEESRAEQPNQVSEESEDVINTRRVRARRGAHDFTNEEIPSSLLQSFFKGTQNALGKEQLGSLDDHKIHQQRRKDNIARKQNLNFIAEASVPGSITRSHYYNYDIPPEVSVPGSITRSHYYNNSFNNELLFKKPSPQNMSLGTQIELEQDTVDSPLEDHKTHQQRRR